MAVALVAIYAAAGFLWAPRLIRSQAEAAAFEVLKKKERTSELLAAANAEIEAGLLAEDPVPESALEALGKSRAQAIQEALLGSGAVDASRVFLITEEAKSSNAYEGKVRLELSLK